MRSTRAEEMASFGYKAFALDVYGKGIRPSNEKEAAGNCTALESHPKILHERIYKGHMCAFTIIAVKEHKCMSKNQHKKPTRIYAAQNLSIDMCHETIHARAPHVLFQYKLYG